MHMLIFVFQTDGVSAEVESAQSKRQLCGGSQAAIERMIHFGRELQSMSEHLRRECGKNSANKKMLKVTQKNNSTCSTPVFTFPTGYFFLNVRIYCFPLLFLAVN